MCHTNEEGEEQEPRQDGLALVLLRITKFIIQKQFVLRNFRLLENRAGGPRDRGCQWDIKEDQWALERANGSHYVWKLSHMHADM
jgi:hypothetical protein